MKNVIKRTLNILLLVLAFSAAHAADSVINDSASLADLKVGKGVFLVDIGDAKKLNFYLEVIQGTYKGMKAQGVDPDFMLVYIGPSVKYLKQEVCAVATRVFGIDNDSVYPSMKLVADGFVSLIGYQAQGYNLVPVF